MPSRPPTRLITTRGVAKVALVTISTLAALTSIVNFAMNRLGADRDAAALLAARNAAWIRTTPVTDTATAIGDTVRFAGTVADRNGTVLGDARVLWTTSDASVATVDAFGQAVVRAPGAVTITATVGQHAAQSRLVVRQAVAAVAIVPADTLLRLGEGEARIIGVRGIDRRGWPVLDRRPAWRSADTTIAGVDSTGGVSARAVGRTTLTVALEEREAEIPVEVRALPASLALADEPALQAPAGRSLPQRVTVRVLSRRGEPARDVVVRFAAGDDGGTEPASVGTGSDGTAATTWTLGPRPGRQRLRVAVDGLDSALVLLAEADPVAANTRFAVLTGELAGRVSEPLVQRVAVRLTDSSGRALPDVPLAWTAEQGGAAANADARTDSLGEARASWTLGRTMGRQQLRVRAGSAAAMPAFTVIAVAGPGPAAKVVLASGSGQSARAGNALTKPLRMRVTDAAGNPVAGARVMVLAASGSVKDSVVTTDSTGIASAHWTLGRSAGQQQLLARPEGVEPALVVTAMARPRAAANVEALDVPARAPAGSRVPLKLTVRDEYGNAVPDARVELGAAAGTVTPRRIVTGADGTVTATWLLGRAPGPQSLSVRVPGTDAATTTSVDAVAPPAAAPRVARKPARGARGR